MLKKTQNDFLKVTFLFPKTHTKTTVARIVVITLFIQFILTF